MLRDAPNARCAFERGCEPDLVAKLRTRFLQANVATSSFHAECLNDPACQPPPDHLK